MQSKTIVLPYHSFVCAICFEIPKDPLECAICCQLFCVECIYLWFDESRNYQCPFRCEFGSLKRVSGAFQKMIQTVFLLNSIENKKNDEDMDIIKEIQPDLKKILYDRDKMWIETAKNWLMSVYKL